LFSCYGLFWLIHLAKTPVRGSVLQRRHRNDCATTEFRPFPDKYQRNSARFAQPAQPGAQYVHGIQPRACNRLLGNLPAKTSFDVRPREVRSSMIKELNAIAPE